MSLTTTADYSLWANVISRVELRWDTALTGDKPFGSETAATPGVPLEGGTKNYVSLTLNIIYMF